MSLCRSAWCPPESPAIHDVPVVVERALRYGIVEVVIRSNLPCGGEPGDEAGFLAIDQRVSTAVPRSSLSLNEAEQVDEQCYLTHVMDNVLKPLLLDNLSFINGSDCVVGHQTRFVRPISPGLLVVHDVGDFIIVRLRAVLCDMITPRCQGLHFVVGKD